MRCMRAANFAWVLVATAALGCTGRSHPQREGGYDFTVKEVIKETCGILQPPALWGGTLIVTGNEMAMAHELHGIRLAGRFLESLEQFAMDGSANNVELTGTNGTCVASLITLHMDGTTQTPDTFTGLLSVEADGAGACDCSVWTTFDAVHR
jgi:hypothetical protein